jgi:hypothetical protein
VVTLYLGQKTLTPCYIYETQLQNSRISPPPPPFRQDKRQDIRTVCTLFSGSLTLWCSADTPDAAEPHSEDANSQLSCQVSNFYKKGNSL